MPGLLERRRGIGMVVASGGGTTPSSRRLALLEPALVEAARQVGQLGIDHRDAFRLFDKCLRKSSPGYRLGAKWNRIGPWQKSK